MLPEADVEPREKEVAPADMEWQNRDEKKGK
jgi:hypothetical protein